MTTYILDTNVISDILRQKPVVISHFERAKLANARFILCEPVNFEVMRGLKYKQATQQIFVYQNQIRPYFNHSPLFKKIGSKPRIYGSLLLKKARNYLILICYWLS